MNITMNDLNALGISKKIFLDKYSFIITDFSVSYSSMQKYEPRNILKTLVLKINAVHPEKMYEKITIQIELDEDHEIFGGING